MVSLELSTIVERVELNTCYLRTIFLHDISSLASVCSGWPAFHNEVISTLPEQPPLRYRRGRLCTRGPMQMGAFLGFVDTRAVCLGSGVGGVPVRLGACNMIELARPQPSAEFTLIGVGNSKPIMGLWTTAGDKDHNACVTVSREGIAAVWAVRPLRKFEQIVTDFRPTVLDERIAETARRFYNAVVYTINFISVQIGCNFRHVYVKKEEQKLTELDQLPKARTASGVHDMEAMHLYDQSGVVLLACPSVAFTKTGDRLTVSFGRVVAQQAAKRMV